MIGFLIMVLVVIVVAGVLLWGLEQLPIDATLKVIAKVVIVCVVVIGIVVSAYQRFGHGL